MTSSSREELKLKRHAGIDLHSNNSVVAVIDEADLVVFEKRLPDELERSLLALAALNQALVGRSRDPSAGRSGFLLSGAMRKAETGLYYGSATREPLGLP